MAPLRLLCNKERTWTWTWTRTRKGIDKQQLGTHPLSLVVVRMSGNNNNTDTPNAGSNLNRLGLSYGIVISVGTMVVLTTILLVSYICIRLRTSLSTGAARGRGGGGFDAELEIASARHSRGIDQATLDSYPTIIYSDAKLTRSKSEKDCCSVCLTDYKDSDAVRIMPDCRHMFHVACIDEWLRRHPTCPVCRVVSPLPSAEPSPLTTPLSEFIPLARNDSMRRP